MWGACVQGGFCQCLEMPLGPGQCAGTFYPGVSCCGSGAGCTPISQGNYFVSCQLTNNPDCPGFYGFHPFSCLFENRDLCIQHLLECTSSRCCKDGECTIFQGSLCPDDTYQHTGLNNSGFPGIYHACPPCPTSAPAPFTQLNCSSSVCGQGCCLCNRCCDMPPSECLQKGGTPTQGCSDANVRTACRVSNVKPPCRKGEWKVGKRPSPHFSGMTIGAAANRMAIFSNAPQRTIDRAPGTEECRVSYAHIEKHPGRSYAGAGLCNTYNRNCTQPTQSGRVRQRMKLVKSATKNAMVWEGRYRPPCPESADFGCTQTIGCP